MVALLSILLPFTWTLLLSTTSAQASGAITTCCTEVKGTTVRRELIKDFYLQDTAMCNIKAVTFVTVKGKRICADISKPWSTKTMKYLKNKNKTHTPNKNDIRSAATNTRTTTTIARPAKNNPPKTRRSAHNANQ
ncbi:hypothetical protein UPYG_G00294540 [Umbra pygmaea]|uniref:Chemokine interleukin-8-like domain-containing protein n=1 Tax=Umbra pygmaea TaxID=75934 RepID=A0ABD0W6Y9_UMBPY